MELIRQKSSTKRGVTPPEDGKTMYKTVIFDLDGTLLNTLDDLADAGNRVCARRGWPRHTPDQFRYLVGNGIPKLIERLTPPDARDAATLANALADFEADYGAHLHDKTAPYPGIPALLARLKAAGVQLAVLSNKADALAKVVVGEYFDPALFAAVRGQRAGIPVKPAPEATRALLETLGADPAATLYVGDSNVDIQTARNAGLDSCGVLWGFRTREELVGEGATHLAADAGELERVVLGRCGCDAGAAPAKAAATLHKQYMKPSQGRNRP